MTLGQVVEVGSTKLDYQHSCDRAWDLEMARKIGNIMLMLEKRMLSNS